MSECTCVCTLSILGGAVGNITVVFLDSFDFFGPFLLCFVGFSFLMRSTECVRSHDVVDVIVTL